MAIGVEPVAQSAGQGALIKVKEAAAPDVTKQATFASTVYERLRKDIISAALAPGQKLNIKMLCDRYGTGLSPIREALNRLSGDGLVIQTDRRGFRVLPLSEAHLAELNKTRIWLNEIAVRESIAHGNQAWEESVLLAYHRLSRTPRRLTASSGGAENPAWEEAHRQFHASLGAACGSSWIIRYCEQLFDAAERYRHLSRQALQQKTGPRDAEHKLIMEAVIARDADKAVELLTRHVSATAELVRAWTRRSQAAESRGRAGAGCAGPRRPPRGIVAGKGRSRKSFETG